MICLLLLIALIRLTIVNSDDPACEMCSSHFYKIVGVLTNHHQHVQDQAYYQKDNFDFHMFCSFAKEVNGPASSMLCRNGDSNILAIFYFLLRQSGCDYDHDIITKGKCSTFQIDHAMYGEDKALICEVCDRLQNLESTISGQSYSSQRTNQILASDMQQSSRKATFESSNHMEPSDSISRYLTSNTSNLELSYSIAYHPLCGRTIDEIIQSYCDCDLHPESPFNATYEATYHELVQFDTCLFNTPKDSQCAMVTTKFIITSTDDSESKEWDLKHKFNQLINSIDFKHSLQNCSIKTC